MVQRGAGRETWATLESDPMSRCMPQLVLVPHADPPTVLIQPIVQVARRSVCTICCTVPSDSSAWPAHEHSRGALQPCSHVVLLSLLAIGVTQ